MCPRGRPRGQGRPRGLHLWSGYSMSALSWDKIILLRNKVLAKILLEVRYQKSQFALAIIHIQ